MADAPSTSRVQFAEEPLECPGAPKKKKEVNKHGTDEQTKSIMKQPTTGATDATHVASQHTNQSDGLATQVLEESMF